MVKPLTTRTTWKQGFHFDSTIRSFSVPMDASDAANPQGPTPKELVALGVAGCTGMDIVLILGKMRQKWDSFTISTEVTQTEGVHPKVFEKITIVYELTGKDLQASKVVEAVVHSQTKYCGVSAMISKTASINYLVKVNDLEASRGSAHF